MNMKMTPLSDIITIAELLHRLGDIPAERVRFDPVPGTATEKDLLRNNDRKSGPACELVDGTLVERPMGFYEDRVAGILLHYIELFLAEHDIGITFGGQAPFRLRRRIVRLPDVSFVSWDQLPNRMLPQGQVARFHPDLAVEVQSPSNTRAEMLRKREEYFRAGARLVWEINPRRRTATVYTSPREMTQVPAGGTLDGGDVLPGFQLSLSQLFERAGQTQPHGRGR